MVQLVVSGQQTAQCSYRPFFQSQTPLMGKDARIVLGDKVVSLNSRQTAQDMKHIATTTVPRKPDWIQETMQNIANSETAPFDLALAATALVGAIFCLIKLIEKPLKWNKKMRRDALTCLNYEFLRRYRTVYDTAIKEGTLSPDGELVLFGKRVWADFPYFEEWLCEITGKSGSVWIYGQKVTQHEEIRLEAHEKGSLSPEIRPPC